MTGWAGAWDQRAVALVELRGTATDHELFESALQARGWPVLERRGTRVTAVTESRAWYVVELRFPGSSFRAADGGRMHLELMADGLGLDLVVEAVDRVERARREPPLWEAVPGTPGRRPRRYADTAVGHADRARRIRAVGEGPARALAARVLPGAPVPRSDVRAVPALSTRGRTALRPRPRPLRADLLLPASLALIAGFGLELRSPVSLVIGSLLLSAAVALGTVVTARRQPEQPVRAVALRVAALFVPAALAAAVAHHFAPPAVWLALAVAAAATGVLAGLGLLVRHATWRVLLPWLVPALVPCVPGLLPSLGLSVPAFYLRPFGIDLEDVDVPAVHAVRATLKLIGCTCLWLLAPAMLGYLKHFHAAVRDRWLPYLGFVLISAYCLGTGVWGLALAPAEEAGRRAVEAAAAGRTPAPYYGIKPEWMCVTPVTELAKVPVEGGELDPRKAYVLLGDADGRAVLWDAQAKAALKIPLASLRLVPAGAPRRPCG
ncbi:hypothetical protein [Streptomyces sp. NPDC012888]|uniref:hypothetical protein n=1 Tax=Streptomyces sp. NPDC012888 TaxID=3364855 RepID=UPI0036CA9533